MPHPTSWISILILSSHLRLGLSVVHVLPHLLLFNHATVVRRLAQQCRVGNTHRHVCTFHCTQYCNMFRLFIKCSHQAILRRVKCTNRVMTDYIYFSTVFYISQRHVPRKWVAQAIKIWLRNFLCLLATSSYFGPKTTFAVCTVTKTSPVVLNLVWLSVILQIHCSLG
jgi:hypothetical protein